MKSTERNNVLPLTRVLCPVDIAQKKGELAQAKIAYQLACRLGAEVEYLYVNPFYEAYASYGPYLNGLAYADDIERMQPEEMIKADKSRLQSFLNEAGVPLHDPNVSIDCQVGPVGDTIKDWLGDEKCVPGEGCGRLIVLSKVRTGGLRDFLLGSVATRIVRTASLPCLVLPEGVTADWTPSTAIVGESLQDGFLMNQPAMSMLTDLGVSGIEVVHAFRGTDVLAARRAEKGSGFLSHPDESADLVCAVLEDSVRHRLTAAVEELGPEWKERTLIFETGSAEALLRKRCELCEHNGVLVLGRSSAATEFGYLGSTLQHLVSRSTIPVLVFARQGDPE